MLLKLGCEIQWTNWSLKTWRFELVSFSRTTDICTVRGQFTEESRIAFECTDHIFFLTAFQGQHLNSIQAHGTFWLWLETGISFFKSSFSLKYHICDHFILKSQIFHHIVSCHFVFLWSHPYGRFWACFQPEKKALVQWYFNIRIHRFELFLLLTSKFHIALYS